jgi:hypothetical protein
MAGYLFTYKIDRAIQYMEEKRKKKPIILLQLKCVWHGATELMGKHSVV